MRLTPSSFSTISSCRTPGRVPPSASRRLLAEGPAVKPRLKEHRAHSIADRNPSHAFSGGDHFAGTVGERDNRKFLRAALSQHRQKVAIVQGSSSHPNDDLTGAGLRFRPFDLFHSGD